MGLATALMILFGGLMFFASILFRTAEAPPVASLNPRHWKPVWHPIVRTWFRSPGYGIMLSGLGLMCLGVILRFAFLGWNSWNVYVEESIIGLVTAIVMLIGFGMFLSSIFYRKPDAPPIASLNPKHWIPVWKQQDHFRGPGYSLMRWGLRLASVAIVVRVVLMGWDSWQF